MEQSKTYRVAFLDGTHTEFKAASEDEARKIAVGHAAGCASGYVELEVFDLMTTIGSAVGLVTPVERGEGWICIGLVHYPSGKVMPRVR